MSPLGVFHHHSSYSASYSAYGTSFIFHLLPVKCYAHVKSLFSSFSLSLPLSLSPSLSLCLYKYVYIYILYKYILYINIIYTYIILYIYIIILLYTFYLTIYILYYIYIIYYIYYIIYICDPGPLVEGGWWLRRIRFGLVSACHAHRPAPVRCPVSALLSMGH